MSTCNQVGICSGKDKKITGSSKPSFTQQFKKIRNIFYHSPAYFRILYFCPPI